MTADLLSEPPVNPPIRLSSEGLRVMIDTARSRLAPFTKPISDTTSARLPGQVNQYAAMLLADQVLALLKTCLPEEDE